MLTISSTSERSSFSSYLLLPIERYKINQKQGAVPRGMRGAPLPEKDARLQTPTQVRGRTAALHPFRPGDTGPTRDNRCSAAGKRCMSFYSLNAHPSPPASLVQPREGEGGKRRALHGSDPLCHSAPVCHQPPPPATRRGSLHPAAFPPSNCFHSHTGSRDLKTNCIM